MLRWSQNSSKVLLVRSTASSTGLSTKLSDKWKTNMEKPDKEIIPPKFVSVRKEYELLRNLVRSPESVDESMRNAITPALSTQGRLAALELPEAGIFGV